MIRALKTSAFRSRILIRQQHQIPRKLNTISTSAIIIMADGIDRKADERLEFSTSKEVIVCPTFEQMYVPLPLSLLIAITDLLGT
jgi:hypothetical protein